MNECIDSRQISHHPAPDLPPSRARAPSPPARARFERRLTLARARSVDARATRRARVELPLPTRARARVPAHIRTFGVRARFTPPAIAAPFTAFATTAV